MSQEFNSRKDRQLPPKDHLRGAVALISSRRPGQLNAPSTRILAYAVQGEVVSYLHLLFELSSSTKCPLADPDILWTGPSHGPSTQHLARISTHRPNSPRTPGNGHIGTSQPPSRMGSTLLKSARPNYRVRDFRPPLQSPRARCEAPHLDTCRPLELETYPRLHHSCLCSQSRIISWPRRLLHRFMGSNDLELLPRFPNRSPKHHSKLSPHAFHSHHHYQHRLLKHLNPPNNRDIHNPLPRHRYLRLRPLPPRQPDGVRADEPIQSQVSRGRGEACHARASADGAVVGRVVYSGVFGESLYVGVVFGGGADLVG